MNIKSKYLNIFDRIKPLRLHENVYLTFPINPGSGHVQRWWWWFPFSWVFLLYLPILKSWGHNWQDLAETQGIVEETYYMKNPRNYWLELFFLLLLVQLQICSFLTNCRKWKRKIEGRKYNRYLLGYAVWLNFEQKSK